MTEIKTDVSFHAEAVEKLQELIYTETRNLQNELANERKTLKRLPEAYRDRTRGKEISKQLDEMVYRE